MLFPAKILPRRSATRSHPPLIVLLLVAALVFAGVLTYQAQASARSHRETAEGTLIDYASFAAWEFGGHARTTILTTLITAFSRQLFRIRPSELSASMFPVDELAMIARNEARWCECLGGVRYFFNIHFAEGAFQSSGEPVSPEVRAWVTDTISDYAAVLARQRELLPVPYGSANGRVGDMRQMHVILTNDSYVIVVDSVAGRQRLLAYVISRDYEGNPIAAFGFESDPAAFATPIFDRLVAHSELLPRSLVRDSENRSLLSIAVSAPSGPVLYRSAVRFPPKFAATDTLEASFGQLAVRVAIRPEIADELIVGGLPRSRLPMLIGLFALTAGLVVVALLQFRRQQELARLRTDFVSGVSHELRTPLAHIRLFAELLQRGQLNSSEQRTRSARVIDQEARRLTFLVENVLSFSRGERDAQHLPLERVDVAVEVRDVLDTFAPLAQARRVSIRAEVPPRIAATGNKGALRQVLLNLLDNAAKYGPIGQTITVTVTADAEMVRITVDDEGPGVPEKDRRKVWEPYYRLERDAESAIGGSGIGLAVVNELVSLQGGRSWVEDAPTGTGARFVVELPLSSVPTPPPMSLSDHTPAPVSAGRENA